MNEGNEPTHPLNLPRVETHGKFFRLDGRKWYVKGLTYGPFRPNSRGEFLPERDGWNADLAQIRSLGANVLRTYHIPPRAFLDDALRHDLRVLIDVPWEKHRCFLEDWDSQEEARRRVRETARTLGDHPAVFAISVVNEFPSDVVRFHGHRRLERFVGELIDAVKQEAPACPATFVNFPTTEFLEVPEVDFLCFNVYLHDAETLSSYLDRLQHLSGYRPLVLGEYGICSLRCGERDQAELVTEHIRQVFRHGLAGSFVFSYTDDWFTGGYQIEDWAFGVTRRDRSEKPCAWALGAAWDRVPHVEAIDLPKISVVVCSYNGAATLDGCLCSLMELDYPDYEVILVDDGSTDETPEIAARYPQVIVHRQRNLGLSAARNAGAELAQGEIVAYTDSDCVTDPDWLYYLALGMQDQGMDAIGGPNIPPPDDGWVARCVAASPGGPSHVMIDDRLAEHIPGCNMAFRRDHLLALGGFDPQFRQAGDDVDLCWRWLDAGLKIGYAPTALVWHHRRNTVSAYLKQQKGYGRAEAMLMLKHPERFTAHGYSLWRGTIYGDGAVGLATLPPVIYHGRFGTAPFQTIYRQKAYSLWTWVTTLEWHAAAVLVATTAPVLRLEGGLCLLMWAATLAGVVRSGLGVTLPKGSGFRSRALVMWLYLVQPIVRGWRRHLDVLRRRRLPAFVGDRSPVDRQAKRIGLDRVDLYWESDEGRGRDELLEVLIDEADRQGWSGQFGNEWAPWDLELIGDRWHEITIRTATEELGGPRRFTRARCTLHPSFYARAACLAASVWAATALLSMKPWVMLAALGLLAACAVSALASKSACRRAVSALLWRAGLVAGLAPVNARGEADEPAAAPPAAQQEELTPAMLAAPDLDASFDPVAAGSLLAEGSNHAC
jgi:glycosyltransferase involved in cell wall biosynthesis